MSGLVKKYAAERISGFFEDWKKIWINFHKNCVLGLGKLSDIEMSVKTYFWVVDNEEKKMNIAIVLKNVIIENDRKE